MTAALVGPGKQKRAAETLADCSAEGGTGTGLKTGAETHISTQARRREWRLRGVMSLWATRVFFDWTALMSFSGAYAPTTVGFAAAQAAPKSIGSFLNV